jgi:hypothetical protein
MIQSPVVIGLTVCEQVIVEEKTHNLTQVNCFRRLFLRGFPSSPQRLAIHAILTNGQGTGKIGLAVARLDTLEDVYTHNVQVTFPDPLREVRLLFRPPPFSIPTAGYYEVSLLIDGGPLTRRVIQIVAVE